MSNFKVNYDKILKILYQLQTADDNKISLASESFWDIKESVP